MNRWEQNESGFTGQLVQTARMTASTVLRGIRVESDPLHLDEIPSVMEKMGWSVAPRLMRRWFSTTPAYYMPSEIRGGRSMDRSPIDYRRLPASQVDCETVKMKWALQYARFTEVFENVVYNWNTTAGIDRLKDELLKKAGWTPGKAVKIGSRNHGALDLEWDCQVNSRSFGAYIDVFDDLYGAIFKANLKVAVIGKTRRHWGSHSDVFEVEKLGVYIRDTYDFNADRLSEAVVGLGVWSRNRMLSKLETVDFSSATVVRKALIYPGFVPLLNEDFRRWQQSRNQGGDFFVFSDVYWLDSNVDHIVL